MIFLQLRRSALVTLVLILSPALYLIGQSYPPADGFNAEASDPEAIELADAVMESMGGWENWKNTRHIAWTIFGQNHVWDKWTGRFRHERDSIITVMNIHTKEGRVWQGGEELPEGEERREILDNTYGRWINNGYWFIMPYKLKDSGVTLKHMGDGTTEDGRAADILSLTFENVGLTPDNKYLVYVDKEQKMVTQWAFYRNATDAEPSFVLPWADWRQYGNVMLPSSHGEPRRNITNIAVYQDIPDAVYESPDPVNLTALDQ